jgi:GAF domain-containing protein
MKEHLTRSYCLTDKLLPLFDMESKLDSGLPVSMYYLNKFINSERSSVWLFQHWNQKLTVYSSLDLEKNEVSIPKSCSVAGWVFVNRKPVIIDNAYQDSRFYKEIDEITGFRTRNLICTPLLDYKDRCLGTLQSLNKDKGDFSEDDLDLLKLAARMVVAAINNSRRYGELSVVNEARRKFIEKISDSIGYDFA